MLAQLSGAVLGALLTKGLLLDEGRATHYGAGEISGLLSGNFAGAVVEAIGVFVLVLVILAVFFSQKSKKDWAPLAVGITFVFLVMVGGPLTTACLQPGPLVRPGAGRQLLGRRLALPGRPDRRLAARRRRLQLRDRGRQRPRPIGRAVVLGRAEDPDPGERLSDRFPHAPGRARRVQ